jgi:hypothetical protein
LAAISCVVALCSCRHDRRRHLVQPADDGGNAGHRRYRSLGGGAHGLDLSPDLMSGCGRLRRQRLHLARDHRKTPAGLPALAASIVAFSASRLV